ncbi:putative isomerase YbhE [Exidia glandulosa HHB12029]|uniref:Putative isomerase YbhE n=1 Tax=Exidia glandulosa HHB12029 TaxID=1314781 RepID=A0A165LU04_EXIGL|nr:putative isomerase YbhE [Exidia glandulosa HHB12029]
MTYHLVVGGYTDVLTTLAFDGGASSLKSTSKLEAENASWLVPHPSAPNVWITTSEVEPGFVRVLKFDGAGKGEVLTSVATGGVHPTHLALSADGAELFVANYSSGDMSVIPLLKDAPYIASSAAQLVNFAYTAPGPEEEQSAFNPGRQESSHPHQILVVRDEVLVPDLGSDKIWRIQKKAEKYEVVGFIPFPRGTGPRHAHFLNGVLYTVCELSNRLAAHTFPPLPEHPTLIASLPTLPNPTPPSDKKPVSEPSPPPLAAEILVPPPYNLIYVSNRNESTPAVLGDSLAVFSPHPDFKLAHRVYTGVQHLRGVAFEPKEGKYLALAGQNGGGVRVFERVESGLLVPVEGALVAAAGDGVEGPEKTTSVTWI